MLVIADVEKFYNFKHQFNAMPHIKRLSQIHVKFLGGFKYSGPFPLIFFTLETSALIFWGNNFPEKGTAQY